MRQKSRRHNPLDALAPSIAHLYSCARVHVMLHFSSKMPPFKSVLRGRKGLVCRRHILRTYLIPLFLIIHEEQGLFLWALGVSAPSGH